MQVSFGFINFRRRWDLGDNRDLKYYYLKMFDEAMIKYEEKLQWKVKEHEHKTLTHEDDKLIVFEKGDLLFIFNFNPTKVS